MTRKRTKLNKSLQLEKRRERNRIAVQKFRDRQLECIKQLELKVSLLEKENQMLKMREEKNKGLESEKLRNITIDSLTQNFYPFLNSESNNLLDEKNPNNIFDALPKDGVQLIDQYSLEITKENTL